MGESVEFERLDEQALFWWQGKLHEKISRRWAMRRADFQPFHVEPETHVQPVLRRGGTVTLADLACWV